MITSMRRSFIFMLIAVLLIGCGESDEPQSEKSAEQNKSEMADNEQQGDNSKRGFSYYEGLDLKGRYGLTEEQAAELGMIVFGYDSEQFDAMPLAEKYVFVDLRQSNSATVEVKVPASLSSVFDGEHTDPVCYFDKPIWMLMFWYFWPQAEEFGNLDVQYEYEDEVRISRSATPDDEIYCMVMDRGNIMPGACQVSKERSFIIVYQTDAGAAKCDRMVELMEAYNFEPLPCGPM